MYRSRSEYWQMIAFAAIMSRLTPAQAAGAADAVLAEFEKRFPDPESRIRENETGGPDARPL